MFGLFKNKKEDIKNEISYKELYIQHVQCVQQLDKVMQENFPQITNDVNSEITYLKHDLFYHSKCFSDEIYYSLYVLDKITKTYKNVENLRFTLDNCDCNKLKEYEEKLISTINKILANKEKIENSINNITFKWDDVSVDDLIQENVKFSGTIVEDNTVVGNFCFSTETNKFAFSYKNYKDCLKYHKNNSYSNFNDMKTNLYSDFINEILNKSENLVCK